MATRKPVLNGRWHRPVLTVDVPLDAEYVGRTVVMRRNPPLAVLDQLDDLDNVPNIRTAVGSLIISHDLQDDEGKPLTLDKSVSQLTSQELWVIVGSYYRAMRTFTELPKESDAGSKTGSLTGP